MTILLIVLLTSSVSYAEFSNGISAGIFAQNKGDESTVQYNAQNDTNGREYKAGDASNQGNAGQTMAWVTGGALTAAGTALIQSPFIWDQIAGADLLAKGAMEFAQAAADGSSSNDNSNQRNLLTRGETTTFDRAPRQFNNPELDKVLAQRGIDPNEFKQRLLSGGFRNAESVMDALGMDKNYNSDDVERGQRLANNKFASILGMGMSTDPHEVSPTLSETSRFETEPSSTSVTSGGSLNNALESFPNTGNEAVSKAAAQAARAIGAPGSAEEHALGSTDFPMPNLGNFLNGMMKTTGAPATGAAPATHLSRTVLESLGIKKASKTRSIFEISQKTYRNFGRWRKRPGRVASN